MLRYLRSSLSRRKFLAGVGTMFAGLLAACGWTSGDDDQESAVATPEPTPTEPAAPDPDPTPTPEEPTPVPTATPEPTPTPDPPEPVRYWIDPEVAELELELAFRIVDQIAAIAASAELEVEPANDSGTASIAIRIPDDGDPEPATVYGGPLIPVAAPDQLTSGIDAEQLAGLFDGRLTNWIDLDGHDREVIPVIHPAARIAGFDAGQRVTTDEELAEFAAENPGVVAMVPRSSVTFHVQSLFVDETDPLRDELVPGEWPWWEQLSVDLSADIEPDLRQQVLERLEDINDQAAAPRRTMMSVVGDIMLGRTVHTIMTEQNDWRAPYPLVADELQRGDLTIGNLECAITDSFEQPTYSDPRTFSFMSYPDAVEGLQFAGFHALSGANNHAMDFGIVGVRDTKEVLASAGIKHFGAGDNLEAARQPCLLEHEGVTYALLGYDAISMHYAGATSESGGVAPMVREYVVEDIQRTRDQVDVVIPFFHWGVEYTLTPTESDRAMAHAAIDAGADLVLGGHPHWVQGMEIYNGKAIFYSLSNFVFDQEWSFETKQGFILHLIFDQTTFVGYRVVPVLIEDFHRPRLVEGDTRTVILGRYWESTSIISGA